MQHSYIFEHILRRRRAHADCAHAVHTRIFGRLFLSCTVIHHSGRCCRHRHDDNDDDDDDDDDADAADAAAAAGLRRRHRHRHHDCYPESSSIASASRVWLATGRVCRKSVMYAAKISAFTFSSLSTKKGKQKIQICYRKHVPID